MVYFFQFRLGFTGSNDTGSSLINQGISAAEQTSDHNGLSTTTIKSNESNTTSIVTSWQ